VIASETAPQTKPSSIRDYKSVYTSLTGEHCITVRQWEQGAEQECPGMGGYRVILIDDDARHSLTLNKDGEKYPLEFWSTVTPYFSFLGKLVEWRVNIDSQKGILTPVALIVRLTSEGEQKISNLVVVNLAGKNKCVVNVVAPGKDQNLKARKIADHATELNCIIKE
jgi:hypothetical protein